MSEARKDWDFVSMADYQADMKESADQAAHVIRKLTKERDAYKSALWAAVKSAGKVRIPYRAFELGGQPAIPEGFEVACYDYDMTYELRAR